MFQSQKVAPEKSYLNRSSVFFFIIQKFPDLNTDFVQGNGPKLCACNRNLVAEDTLVGTAGMGNKNGDDEGAAVRCWILDTGHWFLVSGYWSLAARLSL